MPDDATPEAVDIDEARRIESAMTPGPWRHCAVNDGDCPCGLVWSLPVDMPVLSVKLQHGDVGGESVDRSEDAVGIVHMRNTYGPLLAEVTRLRAALATERRTVEELRVGLGEATDAVCSLRSATRADVERWRTLAGAR